MYSPDASLRTQWRNFRRTREYFENWIKTRGKCCKIRKLNEREFGMPMMNLYERKESMARKEKNRDGSEREYKRQKRTKAPGELHCEYIHESPNPMCARARSIPGACTTQRR
ncbi:uncharacterized protein LOC122499395 isoform X2 [Leptopilina heterotoma]|uniref:uncharacterized protein LOC122499395 isoform X2 n=1 Tax=Leptopilina heterotoma TaxID=63436 RepID=UPI001CA7F948|nr:uncharacterized protein LOC122499395 isoform X2 [Leptopilina heterotoma]